VPDGVKPARRGRGAAAEAHRVIRKGRCKIYKQLRRGHVPSGVAPLGTVPRQHLHNAILDRHAIDAVQRE
jgi:hypothetical protein